MPEPTKPTEDQVKAANEAEEARWQGDFKDEELVIPYKREGEKNGNDESKSAEGDDGEVAGDNDDKEGKGDADTSEYQEPLPVVMVEDPGEYSPADYSFEVTVKGGKTIKVTTPAEAEKLADDPENFETPKQLMDFINKQNKMNRSLEKDYEKWEAQHKTFTEQVEEENQRRENTENFVNEFNYLVSKGLMPKVDRQYIDADWTDPEVAKQPGVKEQIALLNYMVEENKVRAKANVRPLTSIVDAFNAWRQDEGRQRAEEERKAAGEARKSASARVAGVSPAQQGTYVPKGIAVGNPNVFKRGAAVWDN